MTFNDLNYIEKTFTKMLISIHHHRIAYPDLNVGPRQSMPLAPELSPADLATSDPAPADAPATDAPERSDRDQLAGRRASS